jgi:hypothetical protein
MANYLYTVIAPEVLLPNILFRAQGTVASLLAESGTIKSV